ncbi:MAG: tripartite tricarboxylate transporter substrate-binding protein [Azospirillaceae bacterium]
MTSRLARLAAPAAAIACGLAALSATAQEVPEVYQDETLRIMTSNGPGGGFDFYMRTTGKHLEEIFGIDVAEQNVDGAGGTIGDNQLYMADPDGLTIGLINFPGHVFNQIQGHPGVQYDVANWEWLGRVAGVPPALAVSADSDLESLADAIDSAEPVRFGLEGRGSDAYYGTVFLANLLGMPVEQIVGYGGPGEISAALIAGEVDARFESIDTLLPEVENGTLKILVLFDTEADPRAPDLPTLGDTGLDAETTAKLEAFANIYKLERSFVAPPDTPDDRVAFLRDALMAVFTSDAYAAELEAAGRALQPMDGATLQEEAGKVAAQVEDLAPLFAEE